LVTYLNAGMIPNESRLAAKQTIPSAPTKSVMQCAKLPLTSGRLRQLTQAFLDAMRRQKSTRVPETAGFNAHRLP